MWDKANFVLVRANDPIWSSDHMDWSWMYGVHGLFWPLMIVLAAAILLVSFRLGTRDIHSNAAAAGSSTRWRRDSARNTLDERYARGNIDHATYLKRKQELS